ncbi:O-antigen ligase domain-containing protein [Leptospira fletcheri]|uniref:O-antigen ligase domain-containing protein n=1 Tax=Leptospira fletcheri TaxID=2484981 RepID=A0A4R9GJJ1_9LEPT|nr:O-antigen ligase family protein [Leptospira fletcheri]TGK13817.1 O-antigen ligase domain-containing protein [Leptospira fletcheri]
MKGFLSKAHLFCLLATFFTIGISVSLSQAFLVLSFGFGFSDTVRNRPLSQWFPHHPLFYASLLLFSWYFSDFFLHLISDQDANHPKRAFDSELKDFFLFFGFLAIWFLREEDLPKVRNGMFLLFLVLIVTGVIGGFSPVRLSRLVTDLYRDSTAYKFTHPLGSFAKIPMYVTIGLMNTHLTFGGLLQFFSGFAVFRCLKDLEYSDRKRLLQSGILLALYVFVLLLNQARSSLIGASVSILIATIHLFWIRKELPSSYLVKGGFAFLLLTAILGLGLAFSPAGKKVLGPIFGKEKHTDSGRTFIWDSTFPLVQEHPWIGVGPGNYNRSIEVVRKEHSEKYPELSYFYEVTQRGHAHNDYFHFAAVFGLPALFLYLAIAGIFGYSLLSSKQPFENLVLYYGVFGFFVSGLFQCYFQDDEVVILFWLILGTFVRMETSLSDSGNTKTVSA